MTAIQIKTQEPPTMILNATPDEIVDALIALESRPTLIGFVVALAERVRELGFIDDLIRALSVTYDNFAGSMKLIEQYNITIIPTLMLTVRTYSYMTIAGGENTGSLLMNPAFFQFFNQNNLATEVAGWMAVAFNIGLPAQWARLKKA